MCSILSIAGHSACEPLFIWTSEPIPVRCPESGVMIKRMSKFTSICAQYFSRKSFTAHSLNATSGGVGGGCWRVRLGVEGRKMLSCFMWTFFFFLPCNGTVTPGQQSKDPLSQLFKSSFVSLWNVLHQCLFLKWKLRWSLNSWWDIFYGIFIF